MKKNMLRASWAGLRRLLPNWREIGAADGPIEVDPALPQRDQQKLRQWMECCLQARGGQVSARMRAVRLGEVYLSLNMQGRLRFLQLLAQDFAADSHHIYDLAQQLPELQGKERGQALNALRQALTSPGLRLLQQFNALPHGVKFVIDVREELLHFLPEYPELAELNQQLRELLATWFDVGFFRLQQVTWESSAALLEKLMAYEAVHEISSWRDLRNRLESDRRCYAFFHPIMPREPLIFVEIALVNGMIGSIQDVLKEETPDLEPSQADTAIFYSISNAQKGLQGIQFGGFLIKQVVDALRHDFPNVRCFATLSPLPRLRSWLEQQWQFEQPSLELKSLQLAVTEAAQQLQVEPDLAQVLAVPGWWQQEQVVALLREPLLQVAAAYLFARRTDGYPIDPVQRFHLGNGARIEQLNWLGDTSAKGMAQSCGIMVNYRYRLRDIEKNHEAYMGQQRLAASSDILDWYKQSQLPLQNRKAWARLWSGGRETLPQQQASP